MGETSSKNTSKAHLNDYLKASKRSKNKLLDNTTDYSLNAKILKKLAYSVLKEYDDQHLLGHYIVPLKQFIKKYNYPKFASFLASFSWFILMEKSKFDLQMPAEAKQYIEKRSVTSLVTRETLLTSLSVRPFSKPEGNISPKSLHRLSSTHVGFSGTSAAPFPNGLVDFIKQEIMRKNNFFFELAYFFGEIFTQRYGNSLRDFDELLKEISREGLTQRLRRYRTEESRIQAMYETALQDIKEFQEFLYNLLKVFIVQVSRRIDNTDSYVPRTRILNSLATNLLFGRNKCYNTIFSLIRYSTIQHEILLKEAFLKFKGLRPNEFDLERSFCLENERVPYQEVIESLDHLDVYTNPDDKLMFISTIRRQILKALDKYRIQQGLGEERLAVTGDHLLPLFTYCLSGSGNEKLRAHQIFLENFVVEKNRLNFDEEGYCFLTFVGAVDSLTGIKSPKISLGDD